MPNFSMDRFLALSALPLLLAASASAQAPAPYLTSTEGQPPVEAMNAHGPANAIVHCPDGTTRPIDAGPSGVAAGENVAALRFICERTDPPAASRAAAPIPNPSRDLPSGTITCPDGTTRPGFESKDEMNGVLVSMACSRPAPGTFGDDRPTSAAMVEKNRELAIRDAREGRVGISTAIKTAWETGDTLLIAYLAGKAFFFAAIAGLVIWLVRRKSK